MPEGERPATIKDVAAAAGVSWKTVSNVVHERPNVSAQTRKRVLDAIDRLDYRPSLAGRQLRQGRARSLMVLLPTLTNSYFAELIGAVHQAGAERGYVVFIEQIGVGIRAADERAATSALLKVPVDGVLVSPITLSRTDLRALAEHRPVVLLGEGGSRRAGLDRVEIDNLRAAREVGEHLVARGRRQIAFLAGTSPTTEPMRTRLRGYRSALERAGLVPPESGVPDLGGGTIEGAAQATARLVEEVKGLDAIFCYNDDIAIGALSALHRLGVRVPDDVAVTGWDDTRLARFLIPPLTTVSADTQAIARKATDLLISRIEGSDGPEVGRHVMPHQLLIRASTG